MNAIILVDLTFGDAGKGSLVDDLTRRHGAHTVIRFNGGAQAAHNVVLPDGRHHTFSQFGSGTFVPGVHTHLSRFMLFDPAALQSEERHLRILGIADTYSRLSLDQNAPVVTPFHRAANRLREMARGDGRHGSCGMGIGETMADLLDGRVLRAGDLRKPHLLRQKLRAVQEEKRILAAQLNLPRQTGSGGLAARELELLRDAGAPEDFAELFEETIAQITLVDSSADILHRPGTVLFEGAQGVLLDEWRGFHPYTTWSTTTPANALTLLREAHYPGHITRIGALRSYMTRHGTGPFPTQEQTLHADLPEPHNALNVWQKDFRVGWLDFMLLQYALDVSGGVDQLAVTCLDRLAARPRWNLCLGYRGLPAEFLQGDRLRIGPPQDLAYQQRLATALAHCTPIYEEVPAPQVLALIAQKLAPVGLTSWGPTWRDKLAVIDRGLAIAA